MKLLRLLPFLFASLFVATMISCSKSDDAAEAETQQPEQQTPPEDVNWKKVAAEGGTVTQGDLTITFPSATFDSNEQVGVTEAKASELLDNTTQSDFYKVYLPKSGTNKESTITLKCPSGEQNVKMVCLSPGWNRHTNTERNVYYELETTVSGNTATATLPEAVGDDTENPYFYVGLVSDNNDAAQVKAQTRAETTYRFKVKRSVSDEEYQKNKATYDKIEAYLNENVPIALQKLKDQGFPLPSWTIQYTIRFPKDKDEREAWGTWCPSYISIYLGDVYINRDYLFKFMNNPTDTQLRNELQATLVHESAHAIHDLIYEPRAGRKYMYDGQYGDEWVMLDEAMGGWTEKFWGSGRVGGQNCISNLPTVIKKLFPEELSYETCRSYGYGLSAFLEYLARHAKHGDKSLVKLYKLQKGNTLRQALDKYMAEEEISFFDAKNYYDFALQCINCKLIPGARTTDFFVEKKGLEKIDQAQLSNNVYDYGCLCQAFIVGKQIMKDSRKLTLTLHQEKERLISRIYLLKDENLTMIGTTDETTPYEISLDDLCKIAGINKNGDVPSQLLYVVTTLKGQFEENKAWPSVIKYQIQEAASQLTMTKVNFVKLYLNGKIRNVSTGNEENYSSSFNSFDKVDFTQNGSTVHVVCTNAFDESYGDGSGYAWNTSLAFDIVNFTEEAYSSPYGYVTSTIKDLTLNYFTKSNYSSYNSTEYTSKNLEMVLSKMAAQPGSHIGSYEFGAERVYGSTTYYVIDKFNYTTSTKERNSTAYGKQFTWTDDRDNIINLQIDYEYTR